LKGKEMAMARIRITRDGIWAGDGTIREIWIHDCTAELGQDQYASEQTYRAIEKS
jgi:hypothetical protein